MFVCPYVCDLVFHASLSILRFPPYSLLPPSSFFHFHYCPFPLLLLSPFTPLPFPLPPLHFLPLQWAISCLPAHVQGPQHQLDLSIYDVYAVLIPMLVLLTFLPSFKYLAYAAYVGMVFLVVAMVVSDCVSVCLSICAHDSDVTGGG